MNNKSKIIGISAFFLIAIAIVGALLVSDKLKNGIRETSAEATSALSPDDSSGIIDGSSEITSSADTPVEKGTTESPDTQGSPDVTTKADESASNLTTSVITSVKPTDTSKPSVTTAAPITTGTPVTKTPVTTSTPPVTSKPVETTSKPVETTSKPVETTSPDTTEEQTEPVNPEGALTVTCVSGTNNIWTFEKGVLTFGKITEKTVYAISGMINGNIVVDVGEENDFGLDLSGITVTSYKDSPIVVKTANKFELSAQKGKLNYIYDKRKEVIDDNSYSAAVWADCDMTVKGKGSLIIISDNNNGINSKNDLTVKNVNMSVTCVGSALKGKDSVTVESGYITLISTAGDGIKTTFSGISNKGKQKGTVAVKGGTVQIYAANDGISAAYNVEVSGLDTSLSICTDIFSDYTSDPKAVTSKMYLRIPSAIYSTTYRYAVMFYNSEGEAAWAPAYYSGMQEGAGFGGKSESYYVFTLDKPSDYSNMKVFRFTSSQTANSSSDFNASTSGEAINDSKDMYDITSVASGKIIGSWNIYSENKTSGGNAVKSYSFKGIKADNEINIFGGRVTVKSGDDCIYAAGYKTLDNTKTGLGNVNVSGGALILTTNANAISADAKVNISGGNITVDNAYRGITSNTAEISGGEIIINSIDDGMNVSGSMLTPGILISGGKLCITLGGNDCDGIDSTGSYSQTGGFVYIYNNTGNLHASASGIKLDGIFKVTAGTFISAGRTVETPASGSVCSVKFGTVKTGGLFGPESAENPVVFSEGGWNVCDSTGSVLFSFMLDYPCEKIFICSEAFTEGQSYSLSNGSETKNWIQSGISVTVGE